MIEMCASLASSGLFRVRVRSVPVSHARRMTADSVLPSCMNETANAAPEDSTAAVVVPRPRTEVEALIYRLAPQYAQFGQMEGTIMQGPVEEVPSPQPTPARPRVEMQEEPPMAEPPAEP